MLPRRLAGPSEIEPCRLQSSVGNHHFPFNERSFLEWCFQTWTSWIHFEVVGNTKLAVLVKPDVTSTATGEYLPPEQCLVRGERRGFSGAAHEPGVRPKVALVCLGEHQVLWGQRLGLCPLAHKQLRAGAEGLGM